MTNDIQEYKAGDEGLEAAEKKNLAIKSPEALVIYIQHFASELAREIDKCALAKNTLKMSESHYQQFRKLNKDIIDQIDVSNFMFEIDNNKKDVDKVKSQIAESLDRLSHAIEQMRKIIDTE